MVKGFNIVMWCYLLAIFSGLDAQSHLQGIRVSVDLNHQQVVVVNHIFSKEPLDSIPFRMVMPKNLQIKRVEASVKDKLLYIRLPDEQLKNNFYGYLEWPDSISVDSIFDLTFIYDLDYLEQPGDIGWRTIPMLYPNIQPASAPKDFFQCDLSLDASQKLLPVFPLTNWERSVRGPMAIYKIELPVLPAWLKFKVLENTSPAVGPTFWVDVFVVLVL